MKSWKSFVIPLALSCAWCTALSQDSKVVILDHADSLIGMVIDGQQVRELIGNVRIRQGQTTIACDRALEYRETGTVFLNGHVVLTDDSVTIRAPRGTFYREPRRAEAFEDVYLNDGKIQLHSRYAEYQIGIRKAFFRDEVEVHDSTSILYADSLTYFRDERRTVATGNVRIRYKTDNVTITGGHVENWANRDFSRVMVRPVFMQIDTTVFGDMDTLIVRSRMMEAYRDSTQHMIAIDSVRIVRADLAARAGRADFYTKADSILLRRSPVIWYETTQVTGDSVDVLLEKRLLKLVRVMGRAFALSQSDSLHPLKVDQLSGEKMNMHFAQKKLNAIDVENRSTSVYHLYEDREPNGLNKISGDGIAMEFVDGKIGSIRIYGGVEGQYFPERLVTGKEEDFHLPGFVQRTDRPRIWENTTEKPTKKKR